MSKNKKYIEYVARLAAQKVRKYVDGCIVNFTYDKEDLMLLINRVDSCTHENKMKDLDNFKYFIDDSIMKWELCVDGRFYVAMD